MQFFLARVLSNEKLNIEMKYLQQCYLFSQCIFFKRHYLNKTRFFFKSKDRYECICKKIFPYQIKEVNWETIEHKSIDVQLFI